MCGVSIQFPLRQICFICSACGEAALQMYGQSDPPMNLLMHYGTMMELTGKKNTQRLSSNLASIYGFDSTDIWVCDSPGGNIFHYDGVSWNKTGSFPYSGYSLTYLNNIWGAEPNEVYIAGAAYEQEKGTLATLLHYDGSRWKYISLPDKKMSFGSVRKSGGNSYLFLKAIQFLSTGDVYKIFEYNGSTLNEIFSGKEVANVREMNGRIYLLIGKKIYRYQNNQLVLWKDLSNTTYLGNLVGRSEKDFFGEASDGLAHYNGTDLQTIYPTNLSINEIFVMENDVFLICDFRIIIHGKLKNE